MRKNKPTPPELLKCTHCGYQWYSNSKLELVTCPSCQKKFKREEGRVRVKK